MKVKKSKITISFKAGENLSDGDVVYISGAGEVKKAAVANAEKIIGVADEAATTGADVDVVVYGKKTVVADGTIAAGDRLRAGSTAGRVLTENTVASAGHFHTENLAATYTQNADTGSKTDTIAQGRLLGKALGSAVAGGSLEILVCLG